MEIGVRWIGFVIPIVITTRMGAYFSRPGSGICTECEERRDHVYILGNGAPYCVVCITYDLVGADPSDAMKREQPHPAPFPIETPYERTMGVFIDPDDARLDIYRRALS